MSVSIFRPRDTPILDPIEKNSLKIQIRVVHRWSIVWLDGLISTACEHSSMLMEEFEQNEAYVRTNGEQKNRIFGELLVLIGLPIEICFWGCVYMQQL